MQKIAKITKNKANKKVTLQVSLLMNALKAYHN